MLRRLMMLAVLMASVPARAAQMDRDDLIVRVYAMVDCLLPRAEGKLGSMLNTPPKSLRSAEIVVEVQPASCLRGANAHGIAVPDLYVRGAVAEAMLKKDFSAIGIPKSGKPLPVFDMAMAASTAPNDRVRQSLTTLRIMQCVVRSLPEQSYAVLFAPVASDAERRALDALTPAMANCNVGEKSSLPGPPAIRAYLAEAAYRSSVNATDGAG